MQDFKQQKLDIQNEINRLDEKIKKLPVFEREPDFGEFIKKVCFYKFWWSMLILCSIFFICAYAFNWESIRGSRLGSAFYWAILAPPLIRLLGGVVLGAVVLYPLYCLISPVALSLVSRHSTKLEEQKSYLEKELQSLHTNNDELIKKYENHEAVVKSASILADILYNRIQNAFQRFDAKTVSSRLEFSVQYDKIIYFSTVVSGSSNHSFTTSNTVYDFYKNGLQNLSDNFVTLTVSAAIAKRIQQIIKEKSQNNTYKGNYTLKIKYNQSNEYIEYYTSSRHYEEERIYKSYFERGLRCHQFVTVTLTSSNPQYQELKTW